MNRSMTVLTALSAAVLLAGCCGPKSSAHAGSSAAYTHTETSSSEKTMVRDQETVAGDVSVPIYSEELKVGKREVDNGSVKVRKTVKTESVSQPVELRRETVTIDRVAFENAQRSANNGQPNDIGAAFQEKEIVIDLKREEAVVEVAPYISGRIVAQKRATTEKQNIDRQVRREVVEVIKQGDSKDIIVSERVNQETAVGAPNPGNERQTGTEKDGTTPQK